ncbi:LytR family transcriptional regulator [Bacillus canaveralius]|uniref:LytR family transcriptional regulator n=1 Tax=Bacillus canaveralius TaxID=1403243 RepID=A0A2N5GMH4_9BACI|nr:LCP family protein [Bacillus canaveralius]PLR83138.1 LytR family transcriptional regulator [Bacillus canaveralius]PLR94056.1 LytR family transcriptional regulator [Bacillus canaveralius]RSK54143.1 LytR family transcriptional regulator [Bacillus canaveralius]
METRSGRRKRRPRRWVRIFLLLFTLCLLGTGVFAYNFYTDMVSAVDKMHNPISREVSEKREDKVEFKEKDPISILLVGVDEREGDAGRTDTMIVMTINPETKSTKLLSIPRDTRAKLINPDNPNKHRVDKMNHAYAYGGIEMTISSIENFLNVPIDYYTEVNMQGFKDIVDAVGGIEVDNQYEFELDGVYLQEGKQTLDGEEALQYARMRKEDPLGDFGRQERQKEVISKVIAEGKSLSSLTNYDQILEALQENIVTNLTLKDIIGIQSDYKIAAETIEKLEIEGKGITLNNGVWYFHVDDITRQALSDQLREHLELDKKTVAPGIS